MHLFLILLFIKFILSLIKNSYILHLSFHKFFFYLFFFMQLTVFLSLLLLHVLFIPLFAIKISFFIIFLLFPGILCSFYSSSRQVFAPSIYLQSFCNFSLFLSFPYSSIHHILLILSLIFFCNELTLTIRSLCYCTFSLFLHSSFFFFIPLIMSQVQSMFPATLHLFFNLFS